MHAFLRAVQAGTGPFIKQTSSKDKAKLLLHTALYTGHGVCTSGSVQAVLIQDRAYALLGDLSENFRKFPARTKQKFPTAERREKISESFRKASRKFPSKKLEIYGSFS